MLRCYSTRSSVRTKTQMDRSRTGRGPSRRIRAGSRGGLRMMRALASGKAQSCSSVVELAVFDLLAKSVFGGKDLAFLTTFDVADSEDVHGRATEGFVDDG